MKQAESPGETALKQETYPIYELDWEKLKTFLEQRFQPLKFEECRIVSSSTITATSLVAILEMRILTRNPSTIR
jgi:predicted acylesterase/phospholipase RssA